MQVRFIQSYSNITLAGDNPIRPEDRTPVKSYEPNPVQELNDEIWERSKEEKKVCSKKNITPEEYRKQLLKTLTEPDKNYKNKSLIEKIMNEEQDSLKDEDKFKIQRTIKRLQVLNYDGDNDWKPITLYRDDQENTMENLINACLKANTNYKKAGNIANCLINPNCQVDIFYRNLKTQNGLVTEVIAIRNPKNVIKKSFEKIKRHLGKDEKLITFNNGIITKFYE